MGKARRFNIEEQNVLLELRGGQAPQSQIIRGRDPSAMRAAIEQLRGTGFVIYVGEGIGVSGADNIEYRLTPDGENAAAQVYDAMIADRYGGRPTTPPTSPRQPMPNVQLGARAKVLVVAAYIRPEDAPRTDDVAADIHMPSDEAGRIARSLINPQYLTDAANNGRIEIRPERRSEVDTFAVRYRQDAASLSVMDRQILTNLAKWGRLQGRAIGGGLDVRNDQLLDAVCNLRSRALVAFPHVEIRIDTLWAELDVTGRLFVKFEGLLEQKRQTPAPTEEELKKIRMKNEASQPLPPPSGRDSITKPFPDRRIDDPNTASRVGPPTAPAIPPVEQPKAEPAPQPSRLPVDDQGEDLSTAAHPPVRIRVKSSAEEHRLNIGKAEPARLAYSKWGDAFIIWADAEFQKAFDAYSKATHETDKDAYRKHLLTKQQIPDANDFREGLKRWERKPTANGIFLIACAAETFGFVQQYEPPDHPTNPIPFLISDRGMSEAAKAKNRKKGFHPIAFLGRVKKKLFAIAVAIGAVITFVGSNAENAGKAVDAWNRFIKPAATQPATKPTTNP